MLLAELGAQSADVDVDRARAAVVLVAPHAREQLLAGEHLAGMRDEELEQLVLHVGEVERLAVDRGLVRLEVQDAGRRTTRARGSRRVRRGTADDGTAPRAPSGGTARGRSRRTGRRGARARAVARPRRAAGSTRRVLSPLRNDRHSANAPSGIFVGADDRAGPAVGAARSASRSPRWRPPSTRCPARSSVLREQRRRRIGKDEQRDRRVSVIGACLPRASRASARSRTA